MYLRGGKKPSPISAASCSKNDTSKDSAPMSMDDLLLRFTKLLDARFAECAKNLDQDAESKVHQWVDSTFQLLKREHYSKS